MVCYVRRTYFKEKNNKNKNLGILSIMLVGILFLGGVYAFFQYTREGEEQSQLLAGEVYLHFTETGNEINLNQNAFPETPLEARRENRTDNILTFTIDGKNTTENKDIYYEIKLMYGDNNNTKTRLNDRDLRFDLEETIDGVTTRVLNNVSYDAINNTRIWINTIDSGEEIERTYTLRVWISDEVSISDTDSNATYTTGEYFNKYANIKVMVYGDFEEKGIPLLYNLLEESLASYLLPDDGDARIISGGGGNGCEYDYDIADTVCVDTTDPNFKNYVWYSGKLWRIVALNNDGTIKLVTQEQITAIQWGANTTFYSKSGNTETKSWMYEWLNEDFLDTLYNAENMIVMDAEWNFNTTTCDDVSSSVSYYGPCSKPSDTSTGIANAPVGLLTVYEYTQSYSKTGLTYSTGYLNNGYFWWLLTPYNSSLVRSVFSPGYLYYRSPGTSRLGARPSINLSSNIVITSGLGTLNSPFEINFAS